MQNNNYDRRLICKALISTGALGLFRSDLYGEKVNERHILSNLSCPILFRGDIRTGYRDPAATYHDGWFYLYFTMVRQEHDEKYYSYVAWSRSRDLIKWSTPITLTPGDKRYDFGSPGNIVRVGNEWVLCVQTYPRPNGEHYGNSDARIWIMRSHDLRTWSEPELLRVKGPNVPVDKMGRMIDPFLLADKDRRGHWWCFYKQNGISVSSSNDLKNWTYVGRIDAGENPCVVVDKDEYVLFHSPTNGIGKKRSGDLMHWRDEGVITLGQDKWDWARGRITAGFVLDLRSNPSIRKAILFFHGSKFPDEDPDGHFDNFASIAIAWSNDLATWKWPPGSCL